MKPLFWVLYTFIISALFISGCMKMGDNYSRPELGINIPKAYIQEDEKLSALSGTKDFWWREFGDPKLNDLVDEAFKYNPDIRKAAAVILEQKGRMIQTGANRFPSVNIAGQAKRNQSTVDMTSPTVLPAGGIGFITSEKRITTNSYGLSIPATFELDLWGRLARADEAAKADLLQAEENRDTIIQSVIAEVVSLYLKIESLNRQIQLNEQRIQNYQTGLNLVDKRYTAGLTDALEVRQARRSLSQVKSAQPSLHQALQVSQNNLAILCGKYPENTSQETKPKNYIDHLPPVPGGLPSDLLKQRPDIRAAEAQLMALNARVGQAKANRFPAISLTASFGYASDELSSLITPASELWNIASGITAPVFDAGSRKAGYDIAQARYQQGVSDYAKTVLSAFAEVENALLIRKQQILRREQLNDFLNEAKATQEMAEFRYDRGIVDYLTVLDAVQARFLAEEEIIASDLTILQNRVTLHRALGGGWGL
ncbi:MAG: efflux transporter outer membrane subunit [Pseudomonadota bacterium]